MIELAYQLLSPARMENSLESIYAQFSDMYADSKMIRWKTELDAAIRAAGLEYEAVTRQWLAALDPAWVYRESENPFRDRESNQAYRRFVDG